MPDSVSWKKQEVDKILMDIISDCLVKLESSRIMKHDFGYKMKTMRGSSMEVRFIYRKKTKD